MTVNSNSRLGSQAVTWHWVQYVGPFWFRLTWPRNQAPGAGPVAPLIHSASNVSGLNSPMRVTSVTRSHTFSAGAFMWTVTSPCIARLLQFVSKHPAQELAGLGVGQGVSELHDLRGLRRPKALADPCLQVVGGRGGARPEHHDRADALAPLGIGNAHDGDLSDRGM